MHIFFAQKFNLFSLTFFLFFIQVPETFPFIPGRAARKKG